MVTNVINYDFWCHKGNKDISDILSLLGIVKRDADTIDRDASEEKEVAESRRK